MSTGKSDTVELFGLLVRAAAAVCTLGAQAVCAVADEVQKAQARAAQQRRLEEARRQAEEQRLAAERRRDDEIRRLEALRDARQRCRAAAGQIDRVADRVARLQERFPGTEIRVARPTLPPVPETDDIHVLAQHETEVKRLVGQYARAVSDATTTAQDNADFADAIAALVDVAALPARTAAEALASYDVPGAAPDLHPVADRAPVERTALVADVRACFAEIPAESMPDDIPRLFAELAGTASPERADALAVELRNRAALVRRELEERRVDERLAAEWAAELADVQGGEAEPYEAAKLRHQLVLVAQGEARLTRHMKEAVEAERARRRAADERATRESAAIVLESTLQELGYDTDSIDNTLFVEGGTVHYQRGEWGDYYMQLRVVPLLGQANFSLVRVGEGTSSASEDEARQERYCSAEQMGALREALAARGVRLRSRHANKPGEVPVANIQESTLGQTLRDRRAAARAAKRSRAQERRRTAGE